VVGKQSKPLKKPVVAPPPQPRAQGGAAVRLRSDKNGIMHLSECNVPIWRLIMAERAGSGPAALIEAFPGLTRKGLQAARQYAEQHPRKVDDLIRRYGPKKVSPGPEPDDQAEFDAELTAMLDRDAALYRRLAR
jgi:uncharacterized protein (DUF433 family)